MERKRKAYAPFSQTSEAGVAQTPVEGYIDVNQTIYPTVQTGVVNEKGQWTGVKSSDTDFFGITKHVAVPNTGVTLSPDTGDLNFIDMTGFNDIFIAIKPSNGGNYAIEAVLGPDTNRFANLSPVNAASGLRGSLPSRLGDDGFDFLLKDAQEDCTADVWSIFICQTRLSNQKMMQFKITNNSGGESTFEVAFMRLV